MTAETFRKILNQEKLREIFPAKKTNEFFDALFGDASEGSYDIELAYGSATDEFLELQLLLRERPNCCLACNLTQGLPQVFSRHPVINIEGLVRTIDTLLGDSYRCKSWSLGYTQQQSRSLHIIPLKIAIEKC
jgi:hypothetical protein